MSRLKLKQILSNLHYDEINDQLILSSSRVPTAEANWENLPNNWNTSLGNWEGTRGPDFIISGAVEIGPHQYNDGTLTIKNIDSFGDSGSFYGVDLGSYDETALSKWGESNDEWDNSLGTWDGL